MVPPPDDARSTNAATLRALVLLFAVVAAVYWNSLGGVFFFDDANAIESNPVLRELWPLSRFLSAPAESPANGRPLTSFTFALSYAQGGLDPFAFRLGNLLVHAAATCALFLALRAAFGAPRMPEAMRTARHGLALSAALLWGVHPLQSECVNYVSQRTESLMGLFFFLCLHAALLAARRPAWGVLAFVWCLCGMLSKEIMVALPPLLLLFDRTFVQGSFRGALRARWRLYAALASTGLVVAYLMTTRPRSATVGLGLGLSAWEWMLNQASMLRGYLALLVWPATLVADYGMPRQLVLADVALDAALVWGLAVLALWSVWRRPRFGFALAWFFVVLAPTSSFVPIVTEVGAERRVYVPVAALVALVVALVWLGLVRSGRPARPLAGGLLVLCALALGARTCVRNLDYASDASIWGSAVEAVPDNARAHLNLAYALHGEGELDRALEHYARALRLETSPIDGFHRGNANFNVALIHLGRKQLEEARARLARALRHRARFPAAHHELGRVLIELERVEEGIGHLEQALAQRPGLAAAALDLGRAHASQGRRREAAEAYRRAIQADPSSAAAREARRLLGNG